MTGFFKQITVNSYFMKNTFYKYDKYIICTYHAKYSNWIIFIKILPDVIKLGLYENGDVQRNSA